MQNRQKDAQITALRVKEMLRAAYKTIRGQNNKRTNEDKIKRKN